MHKPGNTQRKLLTFYMHSWELGKDTLDMTRLGLSNNKLLSLRSYSKPVCPKGMPISHPRLPDKQDPRPTARGDSIPPHHPVNARNFPSRINTACSSWNIRIATSQLASKFLFYTGVDTASAEWDFTKCPAHMHTYMQNSISVRRGWRRHGTIKSRVV